MMCNFESGYIWKWDSPGDDYILPDESFCPIPVEVGGGKTDTRKVDTSCVYKIQYDSGRSIL